MMQRGKDHPDIVAQTSALPCELGEDTWCAELCAKPDGTIIFHTCLLSEALERNRRHGVDGWACRFVVFALGETEQAAEAACSRLEKLRTLAQEKRKKWGRS